MLTARKFRIFPSPEQENTLLRWEEILRWYWNVSLDERLRALPRLRELRARIECVDPAAHPEFHSDAVRQLRGLVGEDSDSGSDSEADSDSDPVSRASERLLRRGLAWNCLSFMGQQATRTDLRALSKMPEFLSVMPRLAEVSASAEGLMLEELDKAWQEFVRGRRGIPRFKGWTRGEVSIGEGRGAAIRLGSESFVFPKIDGDIRAVFHRTAGTRIRQGRILREGGWVHIRRDGVRSLRGHGEWYLAISVDVADLPKSASDKSISINLGGINLVADSEGRLHETPRFMSESEEKRLIRLQQIAAEKKEKTKAIIRDLKKRSRECAESDPEKSARLLRAARERPTRSGRWSEVMDKAAVILRTAARRRDHWIHNLSLWYAENYGTVIVHEMNLKKIMRRKDGESPKQAAVAVKRNRTMANASVGAFMLRLKYKVEARGGKLITVSSENISRECYLCGYCAEENLVSRGEFACQKCGHTAHADTNAAMNVERAALSPDRIKEKREKKSLKLVRNRGKK